MNKNSEEAKSNYSHYESLLLGNKQTEGRDLYVYKFKQSRTDWQVDSLEAHHFTCTKEKMSIHVEVKKGDTDNFKFLLFAHEFMPSPIVNFDSKNGSHRNRHLDIPFAQQLITTPHFNRYDDKGRRYAYKTQALLNSVTAAQLIDINNCIIHFYDEFNLNHSPAGYPCITFRQPIQQELFPALTHDDPLADAQF